MSSIWLDILLIFLLVLANGWFAMVEIAVVSARKAKLQVLARKGNARAQEALALLTMPSRFLATVQVGISLVGVFAGAFGGATIAEKLSIYFRTFPLLAEYSDLLGLIVVVAGITYLSLVVGELVPKHVALRNPERVTLLFVRPLRWLLLLSYPAVRLLSASSDGIMKLLRLKPKPENVVSEEEIKILVEQGTEGGIFEQDEREMFEGVLELANTRAAALMTPRNRMEWLDLNHPEEELRRQLAASAHTRFPVARGDLDTIVGVLHAKEYFSKRQRLEPVKLEQLIHKAVVIPENASALHALREFKRAKEHIALVINEHGTLRGLLTINDVLEAVVGAIPTPFDPAPKVAVQRADGSWLVEGMIDVDEFKEMFQIAELPNEEGHRYQTLGGFIVNHLSRIPTAGDFFEWDTLRIEVVDMDGPRVDKVLVSRIPVTEEN